MRTTLKLGAKSFGRLSVKIATKNVVKFGVKGALKSASMPLGAVADIAQAGLEYAGHPRAGESVGVAGNIGSGAMLGFAIGGPVGAGVGAGGGALFWLGGEALGYMFGRIIE